MPSFNGDLIDDALDLRVAASTVVSDFVFDDYSPAELAVAVAPGDAAPPVPPPPRGGGSWHVVTPSFLIRKKIQLPPAPILGFGASNARLTIAAPAGPVGLHVSSPAAGFRVGFRAPAASIYIIDPVREAEALWHLGIYLPEKLALLAWIRITEELSKLPHDMKGIAVRVGCPPMVELEAIADDLMRRFEMASGTKTAKPWRSKTIELDVYEIAHGKTLELDVYPIAPVVVRHRPGESTP